MSEPTSGRVQAWVLRVVGIIPSPHGITSEAIYGPFDTAEAASDYLTPERRKAWQIVQAPQVMPLSAPASPPSP